MATASASAMSR
uniref:Uncharacterized protein n=1 Tax=Arundo donax TaxID=35708 RepID=A0A0A8Z450_ARUDO